MKLSPVLTGLRTYPFVRLTEAKNRLLAEGADVIDFGPGEPAQAHRRDESVAVAALVRAYEVLERFAE